MIHIPSQIIGSMEVGIGRMEKNSFGYWLQIGADLGILVGLLFVGFQLYQDRILVTAELSAGSLEEHHARNIALMGDDPAATLSKLDTDAVLDARERFVAQAYFASRFNNWSRNLILESQGLLPEAWRRGALLDDRLWANRYGIKAVEGFLQSSPFLNAGFQSHLSAELNKMKKVYSSRGSTQLPD